MSINNNDYRDIFSRPIRDGVLRVLKTNKPSEHQINLNSEIQIHIPYRREELKKRFRVIKEEGSVEVQKITEKKEMENVQVVEEEKPSFMYLLGQRFAESGKLIMTAATIFMVLFVGLNFSAFSQIAEKWFYPERLAAQQIALEGTINNDKPTPELLPTAGMKRENRKIFPTLSLAIAPLENRIIIPKIGKNVRINEIPNEYVANEDWKGLEKEIQKGLKEGVVRYPGTAVPGQNGNVFITGHSSYFPWDDGRYKDVFALLHDLETGDEFTIYWDQKKHDYKIIEKKVVKPDDTSVIEYQPQNERIATLMTCTPVGTAKNRLILVAEEIL